MTWLLVHSPLVGPSTWRPLANLLVDAGELAIVPDLRPALDAQPDRWPAIADRAVAGLAGPVDVVLGHSGAGAVLPLVADRAGARCALLVDAVVAPCEGEFGPSERFRSFLDELVGADGLLPPWPAWWGDGAMAQLVPDPALRHAIEVEAPRVPLALYDERVPVPASWCRRPKGYLQLSEAYGAEASEAEARGWPVERLDGGHLDLAARPAVVLAALRHLLDRVAGPAVQPGSP